MSDEKVFYCVYGTNGLGVFNNWDICQRELIEWVGSHSNCIKFTHYTDAKLFAIGMYKLLMGRYRRKVKVNVPIDLPINFFILTKTITRN